MLDYNGYNQGDNIEPGYFWCEKFMGEHITVDYNYGKQKTTAKGYSRKGLT